MGLKSRCGVAEGVHVVLDMDETLGYFAPFSVIESMARHVHARFGVVVPDGAAVRLLHSAFSRGEVLRPGLVVFLRHLQRLRAARVIHGVTLFTRNSRAWASTVREYVSSHNPSSSLLMFLVSVAFA
jgi:hypothetical protein